MAEKLSQSQSYIQYDLVCQNELEFRGSRESKGKKREVIGIKLS